MAQNDRSGKTKTHGVILKMTCVWKLTVIWRDIFWEMLRDAEACNCKPPKPRGAGQVNPGFIDSG
jgi:hypothetical protein